MKGFTLIEVLIYTAITAVVGMLMTGILLTVSQVHIRESASTEVTSQLNFVTQTIGRLVRTASNIEITAGVSTSTIKLRMQDSAKDPTYISLVDGVIKLTEGTGATSDLTNNRVVVNALNFKKFVQYPGHDTVSYDVQMTYNSQNPKAQVQRSLSSAIARVSAATFDSNLLPGTSGGFEIGQTGSAWKNIYLSDGTVGSPAYTFGNDTGLGIFKVAGTSTIGFSTQGLERMRIDAKGNVGIGIANPSVPLHVAHNIGIEETAVGARSGMWLTTPDGWATILSGGGHSTGIGFYTASDLSSAKMVIASGGNVGIGTTSPGAKLDVAGDAHTSGNLNVGGDLTVRTPRFQDLIAVYEFSAVPIVGGASSLWDDECLEGGNVLHFPDSGNAFGNNWAVFTMKVPVAATSYYAKTRNHSGGNYFGKSKLWGSHNKVTWVELAYLAGDGVCVSIGPVSVNTNTRWEYFKVDFYDNGRTSYESLSHIKIGI